MSEKGNLVLKMILGHRLVLFASRSFQTTFSLVKLSVIWVQPRNFCQLERGIYGNFFRLGKGLGRTRNPIYALHGGRRSFSGAGFEPMATFTFRVPSLSFRSLFTFICRKISILVLSLLWNPRVCQHFSLLRMRFHWLCAKCVRRGHFCELAWNGDELKASPSVTQPVENGGCKMYKCSYRFVLPALS